MHILSVHNEYQIRGGEDESREAEERLLQEMGHHVDIYEQNNHDVSQISKQQLALRTIWSQTSYKAISKQLRTISYDLVHVQNFFPLISPSIYYAARNHKVPIVQTLRNYRLLCPNGLFFRDGHVCEDCMGKPIPYPGIIHSCYRGDRAASSVTAAMISIHRALGTWTNMVDRFIALTHFAREKFIEGGLPADKIVVKPNFVHPDPGVGNGLGNYALFVGRLSVEKGLDTLLEAWKILDYSYSLKIVGDGPLSEQVQKATQTNPNIEWLGRRSMAEVHELMGNATFLVFPSKWYETFGRVAVESFAKGTPVIAANLGAIAELIENQRTGFLFNPSDAVDLANKINFCLCNQSRLKEMRKEVRHEFESKFTATANYQAIREIYNELL